MKSITSREAAFFATADPAWNADLKKNGWRWIGSKKSWMTSDPRRVVPFLDACDSTTRDAVVRWSGQRADAVAASVAVDAVIDVPAPEGLTYRPYQKAGIAFMRARKVSLNADVPRLGKTIQTLGVINTYDRPLRVLVISPANAKVNWTREARKWLVHKTTVGYAEGDDCPDVDFLVINFTILDRHVKTLGSRQWDVIVVDEAHFLGNKESKRTQAVSKLDGALHVIFLTGTPIYTRPKQLFPMLTRLDPNGLGSNEWRFLRRYCDAKKDEVTGRWNTDGFSNEEELQFLMRKRFMIRREKHDVVNELPTNRQTILLPKTGLTRLIAQEKSAFGQKFDAMFADLEKDLTDAEFEALKEFDTRTTSDEWEDDGTEPVASVRKKLALAKVDMVVDFVEESLLSEKKVVVFAHHREVVKKLQFALAHHGTAVVLGGLSTAARQKEIDRFRDDPDCRVFIGNIMAAGSAISLAAADCVIFAELSWVPSEIDQAEERVWDPVKGVPISVWRLVLEDSLEARIAYVMERRQDSIDRMMVAKYLKKSSDLSL